jgi:hypothetical protein
MLQFFKDASSNNTFPSMCAYAAHTGHNRVTLKEWADAHEEFGITYKQCMDIAEANLTQNALMRKYDSGFAKFIGSNYHGLRDKQEVDQNINGSIAVSGINIRFLDSTSN